MSLNKCNYSVGGKHSCCTHQHYCIFNKDRVKLEKKLTQLYNEYNELKILINSYIGGYYCPFDYEQLIKKFNIVKESIHQLNTFKQKILDNEVDGYGYAVLESTKI